MMVPSGFSRPINKEVWSKMTRNCCSLASNEERAFVQARHQPVNQRIQHGAGHQHKHEPLVNRPFHPAPPDPR